MKSAYLIFTAIALTILILLAQRIIVHLPDNHMGFEPRLFYIVGGAIMLFVLGTWARSTTGRTLRRLRLSTLLVAIALLVFLALMDRCNLLVQYEVWLKRGMPQAFICQ